MTAVNFTYTADTSQYQQSMGEMITAASNMGQASKTLAGAIAGVGVSATRMAANLATAGRAYNEATSIAAAYEQKLSKVEAATVVAGKSFKAIGRDMRSMARDLPGGIDMAVQQVQALQQMGVTSEKSLVPLARTMSKIGAATGELSPALTQAGVQLGKTFGSTSVTQMAKWGDTLTSVKSQAGASADSITSFANAIAPLSKTLGMTQSQVTGFSGAFASAGQDGYLAANTFNKMISDMERSAREGTGGLQVYADTVGMTSKAFSDLVKSNPSEAVMKVFDSLGKGGTDSLRTLEQLGLDAPRTMKTIQAVAQQGNLRATVENAMSSYGGGSTEKGAETAFGGMNDELGRSQEIMQQLAEATGKPLLAPMTKVTEVVNDLGSGFAGLVQSNVVQKATTVFIGLGAALAAVGKAFGVVTTLGGLRALVSMGGLRQGVTGTASYIGANRGKILAGGAGAMAAGAMMDNNMLMTAGTLAMLGSNFTPQGSLGKGLSLLRRGAAFGIGSFYLDSAIRQQQGWAAFKAGESPYSKQAQALSKLTGINEGKITRMFGNDAGRMGSALYAAQQAGAGLTDDAAKAAAARNVVTGMAPQGGSAVRMMMAGSAREGMKAIGTTALGIGSALAPTLLPLAGIAAVAGVGMFGYSQYKKQKEMENLASDEGFSTARTLSEQYGIALRPMAKFTEELTRATTSVSTWTEAINFSADRAQAARELRETGQSGSKLTLGGSREEALAQVMAAGGAQSPEMMAALLNDVAAQRGVKYAEGIGKDIDAMRNDPAKWFDRTMKQITRDAEQGWQSGFTTGYSGKKENVEMAGGVADQMRTEIERLQGVGGTRAVADYKKKQLEVAQRRMRKDLEKGTFDAELWQKTIAPLVGEDKAEAYVDEFKNQGKSRTSPSGGMDTGMGGGGPTMAEVEEDLEKKSKAPVRYPVERRIRRLGSTSTELTADAMKVARNLGLSPDELDDLVKNGKKSESFDIAREKLGLGPDATKKEIDTALRMSGYGTEERQALDAYQTPQNVLVQRKAAYAAVRSSGAPPMIERQRIMADLLSGKPMDPSEREALQGQLAAIDQMMMPGMMRQMTSSQQRTVRRTMAKQTLAWANKNPESEEAQQAGAQAAQELEAVKQEEHQYLVQRAQQAYEFQKSTGRAWEDYYLGVARAQEDFQIQSQRAEEEFNIQRKRMLEEYNINIERAQEDHQLQLTRMAEDTAKGMIQPFQYLQPDELWGLGTVAQNVEDQVALIDEQMSVLDDLRKKGLSQKAIDLFGLADPANAQKVAAMANSSKEDIRAANRSARKANATGEDVRDEQQATRRFLEDYNKGMRRGREDLNRTLRNSEADFRRSMRNSRQDFARTMQRQAEDMNRQMARQLQDFRDMDKEFVGDKKKLMKNIKSVMSGGMGEWDGIAKSAMDDVGTKTRKGWGTVEGDANKSIKYLYDIWKDFALDGVPPDGTGPSTSASAPEPQRRGGDKTPVGGGTTPPPARGDGSDKDDKPGKAKVQSVSGGASGYVSSAGDKTQSIWGKQRAKWDKLMEVLEEYGPYGVAGNYGSADGTGGLGKVDPAAKRLAGLVGKYFGISNIGGYREPDGYNYHFRGQAIDAMIPNYDTPEGKRLGDSILKWAIKNADSLKLENILWRQVSYSKSRNWAGSPMEDRGSDNENHYNHLHLQTIDNAKFGGKVAGPVDKKKLKNMGLWEIGDMIYRDGKAAEAAAASGTTSGVSMAVEPDEWSGRKGRWYRPIGLKGAKDGHSYSAVDIGTGPGGSFPIFAVHDGVIGATNTMSGSYGKHIYLDASPYTFLYAHLNSFGPGPGTRVEAGDKIGMSGWTGNVKPVGPGGAHLHFEVLPFGARSGAVNYRDPIPFFAARGIALAKGGIVTQAQLAMLGEAGDSEAVIPLNTRGVDMLAAAIGRYSVSYEARKARAMQHGTPVTRTTTVHNEDHSTNFNGTIKVAADDPRSFMEKMEAEKRRRNLVGGSRR